MEIHKKPVSRRLPRKKSYCSTANTESPRLTISGRASGLAAYGSSVKALGRGTWQLPTWSTARKREKGTKKGRRKKCTARSKTIKPHAKANRREPRLQAAQSKERMQFPFQGTIGACNLRGRGKQRPGIRSFEHKKALFRAWRLAATVPASNAKALKHWLQPAADYHTLY